MAKRTVGRNTDWESELAAEAQKSVGQAAPSNMGKGGGKRLSVRAGILALDGKEVKGNTLEAIIVDFALENAYYEDKYDPEAPVPPSCYALGRDVDSMEPSTKASNPQAEACVGCPQNEFGSADTGRGKACKNSYRMVLWVPDEDEEEPTLINLTAKLTVFKDLGLYVDSCANDLHRPYWSVYTKISSAPDRKSQYRLTFGLADKLDKASVDVVKKLRADVTEELLFSEFPSLAEVQKRREEGKNTNNARRGKLTANVKRSKR